MKCEILTPALRMWNWYRPLFALQEKIESTVSTLKDARLEPTWDVVFVIVTMLSRQKL